MGNREIRREAWALFKGNYLKMLLGMAVVGIVMLVPSLIIPLLVPRGLNSIFNTLLGTVLFAPIVLVGAAGYFLNIRRGGAPETGRMFTYIQDIRQVLKIWLAALAYEGAVLVIGLISTVMVEMTLSRGAAIVLDILALTLLVAGIWLMLRLQLFSYAAAMDPEAGAIDWLRTSWRQMKGNCGRLFRLTFATYWPYLLFLIAVVFILGLVGTPGTRPVASPVFRVFTSACLWLYMGYPYLAMAAFADDLLNGQGQSAKKRRKTTKSSEGRTRVDRGVGETLDQRNIRFRADDKPVE